MKPKKYLRLSFSERTISHEAIYTHIYHQNIGKLRKKLISLLFYSKPKRRSRKGLKNARPRIKEATCIEDRPIHVELVKSQGIGRGI